MKLKKGTRELEGIVEKPSVKSAPSQLALFGRMILNREIVDILKNTPLGKGGELWVTDAIQEYVKRGGRVVAQEVEGGHWITTGDPLNYLQATIEYALDRKDIGKDFKKFLKNMC